jgi:hypothetical protein
MTHRQTTDADVTVAEGRARFRKLPERIRPEDTFISVPVKTPTAGRDSYSHDEWLTHNAWCGSLL